jgi:hypothetical protein
MHDDSAHQPCPHCARPTVLATDGLDERWIHLGTWRTQCGPPELAWLEAEMVGMAPGCGPGAEHPHPAPDVPEETRRS